MPRKLRDVLAHKMFPYTIPSVVAVTGNSQPPCDSCAECTKMLFPTPDKGFKRSFEAYEKKCQ